MAPLPKLTTTGHKGATYCTADQSGGFFRTRKAAAAQILFLLERKRKCDDFIFAQENLKLDEIPGKYNDQKKKKLQ